MSCVLCYACMAKSANVSRLGHNSCNPNNTKTFLFILIWCWVMLFPYLGTRCKKHACSPDLGSHRIFTTYVRNHCIKYNPLWFFGNLIYKDTTEMHSYEDHISVLWCTIKIGTFWDAVKISVLTPLRKTWHTGNCLQFARAYKAQRPTQLILLLLCEPFFPKRESPVKAPSKLAIHWAKFIWFSKYWMNFGQCVAVPIPQFDSLLSEGNAGKVSSISGCSHHPMSWWGRFLHPPHLCWMNKKTKTKSVWPT